MKPLSRILLIASALLLLTVFIAPIWLINISAPQYPEGLGLEIWVDKVGGKNPNDLNTLNGLNHYIGMKTIEQDEIPELQVMPYIIIGFSLFALLLAWKGTRKLVAVWVLLLIITGVIGMIDFYLWEYDYGHNLSPDAPIKVPGMSYQPPLIGTKQLLNMETTSLPGVGSMGILAAVLLAGWVWFSERTRKAVQPQSLKLIAFLLPLFFFGCNTGPQPIEYGVDVCAHCEMQISDSRFGTEAVTDKGKIYKFDSIECLVEYVNGEMKQKGIQAELFVTDYFSPSTLVPASSVKYIIDEQIQSPMGGNVAAVKDASRASELAPGNPGVISWDQVLMKLNM